MPKGRSKIDDYRDDKTLRVSKDLFDRGQDSHADAEIQQVTRGTYAS
jgi:hypothetical protein